jgi:hypothetical protein
MPARDITRDCALVCTLACTLLAGLVPAIVRAESRGGPQRPSWPDSAGPCRAQDEVKERVERQVGPSAWLELEIAVAVDEGEGGYRLTLDTERDGVRGSRVFEGTSCAEVSDAAALLVLLMLDETRPSPPPSPEPAPAPMRAPVPARPAPASTRRAHATLRAAVLGELGSLPRAGLGAELGIGVAFRGSRVELAGLWLPGVKSRRADDGARVEIALWAARLGYCHRLVGRSLALFGCAGLELGRASGTGIDLSQQRDRSYLWSAGHAALRAALALGRGVSLSLEPALAVPLARRRFVSTDADGSFREALHTPAPVSGRVAIALEAAF